MWRLIWTGFIHIVSWKEKQKLETFWPAYEEPVLSPRAWPAGPARGLSPARPGLKDKKPGPARAENLSPCPVLFLILWLID